jgi:RimJ/RimL family protein N-acetyltransferase
MILVLLIYQSAPDSGTISITLPVFWNYASMGFNLADPANHSLKAGFISGRNLYLRDVRTEDAVGNYHRWMNCAEITRFLESRFRPSSTREIEAYIELINRDHDCIFLAICQIADERHIGNIKMGPINRIHRTAELGILIGEKDCWGKGYATEAIELMTEFAFTKLDLRKLTASAYANNVGSIKAFQKAGFRIEGQRRQQYFCDGEYVDSIMLGLLRNDRQAQL